MKSILTAAAAGLVLLPRVLIADDPTNPQPTAHLEDTPDGPRATVELTGLPNARYVVQYAESDFTKWLEVDSISSGTGALLWQDPQPLVKTRSYRFVLPTLQVFRVITAPEIITGPTGFSFGGGVLIVLEGQCFVNGLTITLTSPGLPPVTVPITLLDSAHGQAFVSSLPDGVYDVEGKDSQGVRVFVIPHVLEKSGTIRWHVPPEAPPGKFVGSPATSVIGLQDKDYWNKVNQTSGEQCDNGFGNNNRSSTPTSRPIRCPDGSCRTVPGPFFPPDAQESSFAVLFQGPDTPRCDSNRFPPGAPYSSLAALEGLPSGQPLPMCAAPVSFNEVTGALRCVDMHIPGVGMDFMMVRTCRPDGPGQAGSPIAAGWDFSYNIRAALSSNGALTLGDGNGRLTKYFRNADDTYTCPGSFRSAVVTPATARLIMTFADQSRWFFTPFDGTAISGRIGTMQDRFGNEMRFTYNPSGQLSTVTDTLGHVITFTWTNGKLSSFTDHMGRTVAYGLYGPGEPGGSPGDLKSCTLPGYTGTSTGNEYPAGFTTTFTYTTGALDDQLNHGLTGVFDPLGHRVLSVAYSPTTDPNGLDYDRCVQVTYGPDDPIALHYSPVPPTPDNGFACVRLTRRDATGVYIECACDHLLQATSVSEFPARSPSPPSSLGGPIPPPPVGAPPFVTQCRWNADSRCISCILPSGVGTQMVWQGDLKPNTPQREKGNLCVHRVHGAGGGGGGAGGLVTRLQHKGGFGCGETSHFLPRCFDGFASSAPFEVASWGGDCVPIPADSVYSYSWGLSQTGTFGTGGGGGAGKVSISSFSFGATNSGSHSYGGGMGAGKVSISSFNYMRSGRGGDLGMRTIDSFSWGVSNMGTGGHGGGGGSGKFRPSLFDPFLGCPTPEVCSWSFGASNPTSVGSSGMSAGKLVATGFFSDLSCRDVTNDPSLSWGSNPLYQDSGLPSSGSVYQGSTMSCDHFKTFDGMGYGFVESCTTPSGVTFACSLDTEGRITQVTLPTGVSHTFVWNSRGQLTGHTHPPNQGGYSSFDQYVYGDASSGPNNGKLVTCIRDAASPGQQGLNITRQFSYDGAGHCVMSRRPGGREDVYVWKACGLLTEIGMPSIAVGAKDSHFVFHDPTGRCVRLDSENRDATGALDQTDPRYSCFMSLDSLGRMTEAATEIGSVDVPLSIVPSVLTPPQADLMKFSRFACLRFPDGRVSTLQGPRAVAGIMPSETLTCVRNSRGCITEVTQAAGSPSACTFVCTLDGSGALVDSGKSVGGSYKPIVTYSFDKFQRYSGAQFAGGTSSVVHLMTGDGAIMRRSVTGPTGRMNGADPEIDTLCDLSCTFDKMGQVTSLTKSPKSTSLPLIYRFAYAPDSSVTSVSTGTTPEDCEMVFGYDTAGRLISEQVRPVGGDFCNMRTRINDLESKLVAFGLLARSSSTGAVVTFSSTCTYDGRGNLDHCTDGRGNHVNYDIDSLGRLRSYTDALSHTTHCRYGISAGSPLGPPACTIILEADLDGDGDFEPLRTMTGVSCLSEIRDCPPAQFRVATGDVNGDGVDVCPEVSSRSISNDDANVNMVNFVVNSRGMTTIYNHDPLLRCTQVICPDGTSRSCTFDARGNMVTCTDQNGTVATNQFDARDRLTATTFAPGPGISTAVTSRSCTLDGLGRSVQCIIDGSTIECRYDSLGNLVQEIQNGQAVSYLHDRWGRCTALQYPGGSQFLYVYDAVNRCTSVGKSTPAGFSALSSLSYLGAWCVDETRANGVTTSCVISGFDGDPSPGHAFNQITRMTMTKGGVTLADRVYEFDENQQLYKDIFKLSPTTSRVKTCLRDFQGRLTRVTQTLETSGGPSVLERDTLYQLDSEGNRMLVIDGGALGLYTMSDLLPEPGDSQMDQYTTIPTGACTYDKNGNLKSDPNFLYTYDALNQLTTAASVLVSGPVVQYHHDAVGRIISRSVSTGGLPPATQNFAYSAGFVIRARDQFGNQTMERVGGPRGAICIVPINGDPFYPHYHGDTACLSVFGFEPQPIGAAARTCVSLPCPSDDEYAKRNFASGRILAATDPGGHLVEIYAVDEFGNTGFMDSSGAPLTSSAIGNHWLGGPDGMYDPITKLYQNVQVIYKATTGKTGKAKQSL